MGTPMRLAIVGGGWAGMAAAVHAVRAGRQVTVFEAAPTPGGRARASEITGADGQRLRVDNGQHILIGAYAESLELMRAVGVDPDAALLRLPLTLRFPDGQGLALPRMPAPLDALVGIARARGWPAADKLRLLAVATGWQLRGFHCEPGTTVARLCERLSPRVIDGLIDPLCVSALNTPAHEACGQVFLRVLRDAMFGVSGGSNLLLPRTDLGALFPEAAADWLRAQGGSVLTGRRVRALEADGDGWRVDGEAFDQIVLAAPPWEAAELVASLPVAVRTGAASGAATDTVRWALMARALRFEAIATVYAQATAGLPEPMLALRSGPGRPAQFVFDRGQLDGPAGLLAFVVSATRDDRATLQEQVAAQAHEQLGALGVGPIRPLQTIVEKRATFACLPALQRPPLRIAPSLWACGDYVEGPYPATLEGAVISARLAVQGLSAPGA